MLFKGPPWSRRAALRRMGCAWAVAALSATGALAAPLEAPADGLSFDITTRDGQLQHRIVRREGGRLDPRFAGTGAAVLSGIHPQAVAADARGFIYVAGQSPLERRPIVQRYTPQGAPDAGWGVGGRAGSASWSDGAVTHLLPLSDGRLVLAGRRHRGQNEQAVLWQVEADGGVEAPVLALTELPSSRVVSMHAADGGGVMLGVLAGRGTSSSLEVHLHVPRRHGSTPPEPLARQPLPTGWSTSVALQQRQRGWQWVDLAQPDGPARRAAGLDDVEPSPWRWQTVSEANANAAPAVLTVAATASATADEGPGSAIVPPMAAAAPQDARRPVRFETFEAPWWERLPAALAAVAGLAGLVTLLVVASRAFRSGGADR